MHFYHVNIEPRENGIHEVHVSGCTYVTPAENLHPLGIFNTCNAAVLEARKTFTRANGCYYCAYECFKGKFQVSE